MFMVIQQDKRTGEILHTERHWTLRRAIAVATDLATWHTVNQAWVDVDLFGHSFGFVWHS